ncbi:ATP-binding protein [bacterium]|nr:ATP-binding protein [bacterium]
MKKIEKLVIPSDTDRLPEVDQFAEKMTGELDFSRDLRDDIAISVSEAVNNAILHGNKNDGSKNVTVEFHKLENGIQINISDEGGGFESNEVPDPTKPENIMETTGRGLLIIRHLMDRVDIEPYKNGTKVTMVKYYIKDNA